MPIPRSAKPIGVTEKSPNGSRFPCRMRSLRRMRGLDPTMLRHPPSMAANPMGMRRRDEGMPVRREIRSIAGRKRAADPIFCMNAEIIPTTPETVPSNRFSFDPATSTM